MDNRISLGGFTYSVELLDPDLSHDLFLDLLKMAGPSLIAAYSAGDEIKLETLAQAFDRLDRITLSKARELFKSCTTVHFSTGAQQPLSSIYAVHFRGRMMDLNKLMLHCLKVQYSDFSQLLEIATAQDGQ